MPDEFICFLTIDGRNPMKSCGSQRSLCINAYILYGSILIHRTPEKSPCICVHVYMYGATLCLSSHMKIHVIVSQNPFYLFGHKIEFHNFTMNSPNLLFLLYWRAGNEPVLKPCKKLGYAPKAIKTREALKHWHTETYSKTMQKLKSLRKTSCSLTRAHFPLSTIYINS